MDLREAEISVDWDGDLHTPAKFEMDVEILIPPGPAQYFPLMQAVDVHTVLKTSAKIELSSISRGFRAFPRPESRKKALSRRSSNASSNSDFSTVSVPADSDIVCDVEENGGRCTPSSRHASSKVELQLDPPTEGYTMDSRPDDLFDHLPDFTETPPALCSVDSRALSNNTGTVIACDDRDIEAVEVTPKTQYLDRRSARRTRAPTLARPRVSVERPPWQSNTLEDTSSKGAKRFRAGHARWLRKSETSPLPSKLPSLTKQDRKNARMHKTCPVTVSKSKQPRSRDSAPEAEIIAHETFSPISDEASTQITRPQTDRADSPCGGDSSEVSQTMESFCNGQLFWDHKACEWVYRKVELDPFLTIPAQTIIGWTEDNPTTHVRSGTLEACFPPSETEAIYHIKVNALVMVESDLYADDLAYFQVPRLFAYEDSVGFQAGAIRQLFEDEENPYEYHDMTHTSLFGLMHVGFRIRTPKTSSAMGYGFHTTYCVGMEGGFWDSISCSHLPTHCVKIETRTSYMMSFVPHNKLFGRIRRVLEVPEPESTRVGEATKRSVDAEWHMTVHVEEGTFWDPEVPPLARAYGYQMRLHLPSSKAWERGNSRDYFEDGGVVDLGGISYDPDWLNVDEFCTITVWRRPEDRPKPLMFTWTSTHELDGERRQGFPMPLIYNSVGWNHLESVTFEDDACVQLDPLDLGWRKDLSKENTKSTSTYDFVATNLIQHHLVKPMIEHPLLRFQELPIVDVVASHVSAELRAQNLDIKILHGPMVPRVLCELAIDIEVGQDTTELLNVYCPSWRLSSCAVNGRLPTRREVCRSYPDGVLLCQPAAPYRWDPGESLRIRLVFEWVDDTALEDDSDDSEGGKNKNLKSETNGFQQFSSRKRLLPSVSGKTILNGTFSMSFCSRLSVVDANDDYRCRHECSVGAVSSRTVALPYLFEHDRLELSVLQITDPVDPFGVSHHPCSSSRVCYSSSSVPQPPFGFQNQQSEHMVRFEESRVGNVQDGSTAQDETSSQSAQHETAQSEEASDARPQFRSRFQESFQHNRTEDHNANTEYWARLDQVNRRLNQGRPHTELTAQEQVNRTADFYGNRAGHVVGRRAFMAREAERATERQDARQLPEKQRYENVQYHQSPRQPQQMQTPPREPHIGQDGQKDRHELEERDGPAQLWKARQFWNRIKRNEKRAPHTGTLATLMFVFLCLNIGLWEWYSTAYLECTAAAPIPLESLALIIPQCTYAASSVPGLPPSGMPGAAGDLESARADDPVVATELAENSESARADHFEAIYSPRYGIGWLL